ncbi:hypothetical protein [Roseibium sediminicola]|uniref:Uncharacterized protein n=1 Tax=Roseibium sediminicola TaxID=2933272 RepID=A0ABT0GTZ1_9HYPH|nr:hypothetical protein [Roseibium sp. CAU 1639]MCK7612902.1 hypothetical protein [Roseibium sp. CAU 1639]
MNQPHPFLKNSGAVTVSQMRQKVFEPDQAAQNRGRDLQGREVFTGLANALTAHTIVILRSALARVSKDRLHTQEQVAAPSRRLALPGSSG